LDQNLDIDYLGVWGVFLNADPILEFIGILDFLAETHVQVDLVGAGVGGFFAPLTFTVLRSEMSDV
jgi:hypothetical protein